MVGMLTPGTVFAGYRIERVLGTGGMGTVYAARHPRLPRHDALKVLPEHVGTADEFRARFLREAEFAARLDHPNVVAVHDRGIEHGRLWIATEFVNGVDAAQLLRRDGVVAPPQVMHIVTEAARGLDEAHRCGMLHRDVKPANILIERLDDAPDRVLVADFGIARAAGDGTALTEVGTVVATLAYAAPELLTDQQVDHRADVYALGCTLFELLTGTKPYPRDSVVAVMRAHQMEPPPRTRAMRPELPPAIDAVIARALAKNPDDRYSSCGALAAATASAFGSPVDQTAVAVRPPVLSAPLVEPPAASRSSASKAPSRPKEPPPPWSPPHRQWPRRAAIAATVITVAVAITGVVVWNRHSSEPTAGPVAPTSSAAGLTWGRYAFIVEALPQLLPATPTRTGHQGIRCAAIEDKGKAADLNRVPGRVAHMRCTGNQNPVRDIDIQCASDRTPYYLVDEEGFVHIGDQRWERASGRGRVIWSNIPDQPGQIGVVGLEFEEPTRNFCMVVVIGGSSGQDLYDRWWPSAPF
ncbi:serine/threonine-protein kinase [Nocardia sp. NPDC049149]|uniref:serine/threonine-protein kinase n=1 Tax=Nocardia sp. NPDC049149 TaxID=3364315 RepID=UPI00371F1983